MDDDDRRAKRSRFDQVEPAEHRRQSRFDRRSRSPSSRHSNSTRHRSPQSREPRSPEHDQERRTASPAAAAAAAAARINAQLQAKKGDISSNRSAASPGGHSASPGAQNTAKLEEGIYVADGDYIKDIEVNDLRNRYTLTKGSTQKMIKEETGADVTTRGSYYPDKSMATPANPPLYLHVTSTTREGLEKAVAKIEELMKQELPNLIDERRFRRREQPEVERDEYGRRKWPEERIPVDLEPIPGFNLRAQVIKGRGSGFTEYSTGKESDEPMYLHVAGPNPDDVQAAKELCEDLLGNVREQYQRFKENPPQHNYGGYGSRGDRHHSGSGHGGGYNGQHQQYQQHQQGYSHQSQQYQQPEHSPPGPAAGSPAPPPSTATGGSGSPTTADYSAQYAQYYGADPYAAYGGYQNYVAYYQYYQQQAAQQQQTPQSTNVPPPPPPPSGEAPPPPPAPGAGSPPPPPPPPGGSYNAVPPPPGL